MRKFIFLHINKTGGTTFVNLLHEAFKNKNVYYDTQYKYDVNRKLYIPNKSEKMYPPMTKIKIHEVDILAGHFTVNKYSYLGWPFVTFLRHPIERVTSAYSVWVNTSKHNFDKSIIEYAKLCPNFMTQLTGGNLDRFWFVGITEMYNESLERFGKLVRKKFKKGVRKNITSNKYKKYKPNESERQMILDMNRLDLELYNEGVKKLKSY